MFITDFLSDLIVRPPRASYEVTKLEKEITYDKYIIKRQDVVLKKSDDDYILGSFFPPTPSFAPGNPCIIFLHGNASSQIEGMFLPKILYNLGIAVLTLDLGGSGNSYGQYISLGYHERDDVRLAIEYLRKKKDVDNIVLWGRSMGASIAAWCAAEKDLHLSGVISDSPYISVDAIISDMIGDSPILKILSKLFVPLTDRKVKKKIGVSLHQINLIEDVKKARVPLFIIHTKSDSFIKVHQGRELFDAYGGNRKFLYTPKGDHATHRQNYTISQALYFALDCFELDQQIDDIWDIDDNSSAHFVDAIALAASFKQEQI